MPTEPPAGYWADKASYDAVLVEQFLMPLREAAAHHGQPTMAEQRAVLDRLHWYFTVDGRPVAPTLVVDAPLAATFHRRVTDIMRYIAVDALREMSPAASPEVRHALLSYKDVKGHSSVTIDTWDDEQGLARLAYWVHGEPPAERFIVDGRVVEPAFGKYRACRYFRRNAVRQRIAWIPVKSDSVSLQMDLGGAAAQLGIGPQPFDVFFARESASAPAAPNELLREARASYLDGRPAAAGEPGRWARCKAWGLKALARTPVVRARFRGAWVFADREHDADDNAEHLYRWVTEHHPGINAWFLLKPGTADWTRLERAGFRLVAPGLRRKLLLLNSAHVISSHPENAESRFDRRVYGDAMRWRFTYLKHGVVYNDLSHYYAIGRFDCLISPSPAEYRSFVGDDTPYTLTRREVRRCNAPRHDRLLKLASERGSPDQIVVMPTWRGRLIDDDLAFDERLRRMRASEYAHAWRTLLNDRDLQELARSHGKKVVLVPHSNLIPYLQAFEVPDHVAVASRDRSIQEHFARCFVFITDYTSAAFDVALLRRHILYFQFDREQFFAGGHNWRPGYFDYERDGFGPVAATVADAAAHLRRMMRESGASGEYLARMERAMPDAQVGACAQVFDFINELHRPFEGWDRQRIASQSTPRALRAM